MSTVQTPLRSWLAHAWPIAAALTFATFVAFGTGTATTDDIAPVVTASGFVYLGAAALQRRISAWPLFFVSVIVITIGLRASGLDPSWSSWAMLGIAAVLAAAAITAIHVDTVWAGLLVGVGLLAHTAWDVYHHRTERVVVRSMSLFCAVLDSFLAVFVLAVTFA